MLNHLITKFMLHEAFPLRSSLTEAEGSTSYYICGYVAFMENFAVVGQTDAKKNFQAQNLLFCYLVANYRIF